MKNSAASKKLFVCLFFLFVVFLSGCGRVSASDVSDISSKIIYAMMNTPNPELFNESMITEIGMGVAEPSEEEKAEKAAALEAVYDNWNAAVGDCFSENGLDAFLNAGPACRYLAESFLLERETEVVSLALVSRDDTTETIDVTLSVDGEEQQVTVAVRFNSDGLVYEVSIV